MSGQKLIHRGDIFWIASEGSCGPARRPQEARLGCRRWFPTRRSHCGVPLSRASKDV